MSDPIRTIETDIERTRQDLAQTVDELAARADVKARVQHKVQDTKAAAGDQVHALRDRATTDSGKPSPALLAAGGAFALAAVAVGVLLWRRSRS